jgi:hypothetical protein
MGKSIRKMGERENKFFFNLKNKERKRKRKKERVRERERVREKESKCAVKALSHLQSNHYSMCPLPKSLEWLRKW